MTSNSATTTIAAHAVRLALKEKIVVLLGLLFIVLVVISAWLGWSATSTVNNIYLSAATFLTDTGQVVPPNPVHNISPLTLMRNMVVYVALIGALSAIVIGNRLVALDRRNGVVPLISMRPVTRAGYALGKIAALVVLVLALTGVAAAISAITFLVLPQTALVGSDWLRLLGFFELSATYMLLFGLLAVASAAVSRSESVGLLIPVTIWLTLTFILPSLTANILPTAAINPIAALAPAPDTAFFHWTQALFGPLSLAESYKISSASLLNFLPAGRGGISPLAATGWLFTATALSAVGATFGLARMDRTTGDIDV